MELGGGAEKLCEGVALKREVTECMEQEKKRAEENVYRHIDRAPLSG